MITFLGRRLRLLRDDEGGAILIIALIIVTTVALVTTAVLTRGQGSVKATVALRDVANNSYSADAAAQVAINDLRTGHNIGNAEPSPWYYTNATGTGCFGYDSSGAVKDTLTLDNLIPKQAGDTTSAMSAAVRCTPEDATGQQGSAVPINNANKPGNAILTLGTGGETGFKFKTNGSGAAFRVRGGIWSNSNIVRDNNGVLESTESIRARTGCSPVSAMSAPVVNCNAGAAGDPNYRSDLDLAGLGVPTLRNPPANCNSGSVTLQPGYYDDVTKLNALTDTNQSCFLHFQPGAYYFDFHNNSADALYDADIATGGGNLWRIGGRKTLVGGTLTGGTTVPGRCVNPIDDVNAQGVQFIFGGDSRMQVNANGQASAVEICATYHPDRPPIAVYGQKTGTATATTLTGPGELTTSGTPTVTPAGSAGTFTQATAANLQQADGNQATNANLAVWARDASGPNSAQSNSITMGGFSPATALPPGAVLTGAKLKITHRSTGSANAITLTPTVGTAPISYTLPARTTLGTETVDLAARTGWGVLQKVVHDSGFTGASVKFDASLGRDQTSQLDAVRLELTYYLPALRGQTTTAIPGNTVATVAGSPVVQALGNSTSFYIQGTTYVPLASISLELNNINESVFRFGVIARALDVFETGSFAYPGAVIELPDNSPGFGFETTLVRLEVFLCPGVTSGCAPSGEPELTSRVRIFDDGGTPGPPHRQISVLNWSHRR
ncbi:hypothetical protein NODU109028_07050 [Nocardioides dubius]|uniref:Type 4 fimbrial biogenesis protein PilX N-terminal domain-containing protein n=1 Tax=Nocardioides dubius TaxID=317019 RepID=A0ABP4EH17_9ACTN